MQGQKRDSEYPGKSHNLYTVPCSGGALILPARFPLGLGVHRAHDKVGGVDRSPQQIIRQYEQIHTRGPSDKVDV